MVADNTKKLQELIDNCSKELIIKKGIYHIKPLFLKSDMTLILEEGAILCGLDDKEGYPIIPTRVAGIDMDWYPALINVINANNVVIKGKGIVDGKGKYYWEKYWGSDTKGGMRKDYDRFGLRAFCDYDCKRPRNILIQGSTNVKVEGISLKDSGFWNLHILYSSNVIVDGIKIDSANKNSPSTDGIDIDSSHDVIIMNNIISTNDDSICVKSGRDASGIRKNLPSYNVEIRNNILNEGFGITIGSELSGGIHDISIFNNSFNNTDCGFRIKSSLMRKGYVRDIRFYNNTLVNTKYLIHIDMKWNSGYNNFTYDKKYHKPYYDILTDNSLKNLENTKIEGIIIENINSTFDSNYKGISRIFNIRGFEDKKIEGIKLINCNIIGHEYGLLENLKKIEIINSNIKYDILIDENQEEYDTR